MFNLTVDEAHTFYVGTNGWLVHNCGEFLKGRLKIDPNGTFSQSEVNAAWHMASDGKGNVVQLRMPTGARAATGDTSDLLVNGVQYDVYTPVSSNPNSIFRGILDKNNQAQGVVVDLSKTNVTPDQLGNIMARLAGAAKARGFTLNIKDVVIIGVK